MCLFVCVCLCVCASDGEGRRTLCHFCVHRHCQLVADVRADVCAYMCVCVLMSAGICVQSASGVPFCCSFNCVRGM